MDLDDDYYIPFIYGVHAGDTQLTPYSHRCRRHNNISSSILKRKPLFLLQSLSLPLPAVFLDDKTFSLVWCNFCFTYNENIHIYLYKYNSLIFPTWKCLFLQMDWSMIEYTYENECVVNLYVADSKIHI